MNAGTSRYTIDVPKRFHLLLSAPGRSTSLVSLVGAPPGNGSPVCTAESGASARLGRRGTNNVGTMDESDLRSMPARPAREMNAQTALEDGSGGSICL